MPYRNKMHRFWKDAQARFIEDALYIAGAVIAVIAVVMALGPKIANVFQMVLNALPGKHIGLY